MLYTFKVTILMLIFCFFFCEQNSHQFYQAPYQLTHVNQIIFLGTSLSRPPPKKKPIGRPMKTYTLENTYEDMNKCHDFQKMVDHQKSYDLQVEWYCKSSPDPDLGGPSNSRRRFTNQKKAEMRLHYSYTGNFRETARAFNLNESTV